MRSGRRRRRRRSVGAAQRGSRSRGSCRRAGLRRRLTMAGGLTREHPQAVPHAPPSRARAGHGRAHLLDRADERRLRRPLAPGAGCGCGMDGVADRGGAPMSRWFRFCEDALNEPHINSPADVTTAGARVRRSRSAEKDLCPAPLN